MSSNRAALFNPVKLCWSCSELKTYRLLSIFLGLGRAEFVNKTVSFDDHIKTDHNLWHYLYFIVLLKIKKRTDFTGPQSYVYELIKVTYLLECKQARSPKVLNTHCGAKSITQFKES